MVPFGIRPSPSPIVIIIKRDQAVALGVDRISRPFGAAAGRATSTKRRGVGDMLDHFHRGDEVELALRALDRGNAVVDLEPHAYRMLPGDGNHLGRGVDPGDLRAQSRQRLGQQSNT